MQSSREDQSAKSRRALYIVPIKRRVQILAMATICVLTIKSVHALGFFDLKAMNLASDPAFSCRDTPQTAYIAIRTWDEWVSYCRPQDPQLAAVQKTIDFNHYTLLVAHAGMRPNLGYRLMFVGVSEQVNDVYVSILEITPGDRPTLQAVMPNLSAYALIPKTAKPAHFETSEATYNCSSRKIVN